VPHDDEALSPDSATDLHDDLISTSESLEADARRVVAIESQKQTMAPGDPRLVALSNEAARLGAEIEDKSRIEKRLADRGAGPGTPMWPQRPDPRPA
jgi:hypothetical protein